MKLLTLFGLALFAGAMSLGFFYGGVFKKVEPTTLDGFLGAYEIYKALALEQDGALIAMSLGENPERLRLNSGLQAVIAAQTPHVIRMDQAETTLNALTNLRAELKTIEEQNISIKAAIDDLDREARGLEGESRRPASDLAALAFKKFGLVERIAEQSRILFDRTERVIKGVLDEDGVLTEKFLSMLQSDLPQAQKDNAEFNSLFEDFSRVNDAIKAKYSEISGSI